MNLLKRSGMSDSHLQWQGHYMPDEQLQELLVMTSTAQRLAAMYDALIDGIGYLAARSTLKDMF